MLLLPVLWPHYRVVAGGKRHLARRPLGAEGRWELWKPADELEEDPRPVPQQSTDRRGA